MPKKILTLDNLYQFFVEQNKTVTFSSKDAGKPIVVTTPGFFSESESDMPGMLKLKLKVCHTQTNRNGSHISESNMKKAMPTLKYRPILAYIHELNDGTKDFYAHNMEIVEGEDGESEIQYIEKQVGCYTADEPWLEYDKDNDKTYVYAYAVIPEDYTEAADIIRSKNGTKVSCELVINTLEYNAKEKYLDLIDFYFAGTTLLGVDECGNEISEGMLGARADIADFCCKEPKYNYSDKLIETLEKINFTLESFNKQNNVEDKGGERDMGKIEELLAKYGKTAEEIPFEVEGLSDEELEAKFEEAFGEVVASNEEDDTPSVSDKGDGDEPVATEEEACGKKKKKCSEDDDEPVTTEDEACGKKKKKCSIDEAGNMSVSFEISHDDIRVALYNLIEQYDEIDNEYYGIRAVYDKYFVMQGWCNGKLYRQAYTVDGDNVALEGDRQEVFEMILTESEKLAIEKMREDYTALEGKYSELKAFKDSYDAAQLKAQKDAVFASEEYSVLADDEAFKALVADAEKFSLDEIKVKADLVFAAYVKKQGEFSTKKTEEKKPKIIGFNFNKKETKSGPYGNLFKKD